jgi:hypothetical protein
MIYLKWDSSTFLGLEKVEGMQAMYTEVDDNGVVRREVGLDRAGRVVHRFPSAGRLGERGLFDLVPVTAGKANMNEREFSAIWALPGPEPWVPPTWHRWLRRAAMLVAIAILGFVLWKLGR